MKKIIGILILIAVIGGVVWLVRAPGKPGKLDAFASCIKDSGAVFYGAFWCPHCQEQKALFGRSAKLLPYKECSTPNGQNQIAECTDAGVDNYPTWDFTDGSRQVGVLTLNQLSEKTSCVLPEDNG